MFHPCAFARRALIKNLSKQRQQKSERVIISLKNGAAYTSLVVVGFFGTYAGVYMHDLPYHK